MATLADFKRQLVVGAKIKGGYFGKPNHNKDEVREVISIQSNGVWLKGEKGRSFFEIPKAKCSSFDGETLKIYETGWRALTDEEKSVMEEWKKVADTEEFKRRAEVDILTDGSSTYWQEKAFYEDRGMAHLFTHTATKYLDHNKYSGGEEFCVRDNQAEHGAQIAEYKIVKGE